MVFLHEILWKKYAFFAVYKTLYDREHSGQLL
mgnify:CR=1 FL=1